MTTRGAAFAILLAESHATVVGEPLVPEGMSGDAAAAWLYAANYRGPRIAKSGRRFWIEDTTVWNLLGSESELLGQAALIRNWADD